MLGGILYAEIFLIFHIVMKSDEVVLEKSLFRRFSYVSNFFVEMVCCR